MKKVLSLVLALLLVVGCVTGLAACKNGEDTPTNPQQGGDTTPDATDPTPAADPFEALKGTYDITVWVSESAGVKEKTIEQIDAFEAAHPGIVINATVEGVTEAESATQMINSVEDGADLYCFAQDQLARLVQAGALTKLGEGAKKQVTELNDAGSVAAATVGSDMWCYPMTSDNGYFMIYDKSVVSEDHLGSFEDIIKDCEAAGKTFCYELETSAWYNAGFFFAVGCHSNWTNSEDGKSFVSVDDDFNSDKGVIALKGMQKLLSSTAYKSSSNGDEFTQAIPAGVLISGTWATGAAKEALGDNYACAELPSFTVDGTSYHLGSYSGNKLMGVKPQNDSKKTAVLQQLALYLTNEECQLDRFELVGWGPSNVAAQQNDAVKADPALSALAAQSAYAIPQGQIHGSWWDIAKVYATAAKEAKSDDDLKTALANYETSIQALFTIDPEVANAFTVIGSINGDTWTVDLPMTKQDDGSWITNEAYTMDAGVEFKVRQGKAWDVSYGVGAENFKVETAGTYKIQLVLDGENGTINLIPA